MVEVKEYEKKTMSGECRYCGEFQLVQAADEKEANLLATEQCTCEGATKERDRRNTLMRLRTAMQEPEEMKMADGGLKFQQVKKIEMEELC
jgi:hypothetical protein